MIVHDSFSVSCFGNHRPDSGHYFLKCFSVHAEHFVVSGSVLHSQFFHQFLHSAFVSPFDPFPCPSSLPPTLSRFIFLTFFRKNDYQKTLLPSSFCLRSKHSRTSRTKLRKQPSFFFTPSTTDTHNTCAERGRARSGYHILKKFKAFLASSFVRGVLRSTTALVYKLFIRRFSRIQGS